MHGVTTKIKYYRKYPRCVFQIVIKKQMKGEATKFLVTV